MIYYIISFSLLIGFALGVLFVAGYDIFTNLYNWAWRKARDCGLLSKKKNVHRDHDNRCSGC